MATSGCGEQSFLVLLEAEQARLVLFRGVGVGVELSQGKEPHHSTGGAEQQAGSPVRSTCCEKLVHPCHSP